MKRVADMTREELEREALTDPMTVIPNRRAYDEAEEDGPAILYAVFDIEGTKWFNDEFGHLAGDALIQAAAHVLALYFGDQVYRIGGDEFVVRFETAEAAGELGKVVDHFPLLGYGLGTSLEDADNELAYWRTAREQAGERARRGERPRQLARVLGREVG